MVAIVGQVVEISLEIKPWKHGGNFQVWFRPYTADVDDTHFIRSEETL